jgi:hypothetical protein
LTLFDQRKISGCSWRRDPPSDVLAARTHLRAHRNIKGSLMSTDHQSSNTYVIERDLPGAGKLSSEELGAISRKSCGVLNQLGSNIRWIHSYVTDDRLYCIYSATEEGLIRRHAELGGFPCTRVSRVATIIDPSTAAE